MGKIKLNRSGVRDLLKSAEMKSICEELASAALSRCGTGYKTNSQTGKNRVNAEVYADSRKARADNAKNNTILKALK